MQVEETFIDLDNLELEKLPEEQRRQFGGPGLPKKLEQQEKLKQKRIRQMNRNNVKSSFNHSSGLFGNIVFERGMSREERKLQQTILLFEQQEKEEKKKRIRREGVKKTVKKIKTKKQAIKIEIPKPNSPPEHLNIRSRNGSGTKLRDAGIPNTHLNQKHGLAQFMSLDQYMSDYQKKNINRLIQIKISKQLELSKQDDEFTAMKVAGEFECKLANLCTTLGQLNLEMPLKGLYSQLNK